MSPDGKPHNQIDHILIDRSRHSSVLHVRSFRAADCATDHYLVVAKNTRTTLVSWPLQCTEKRTKLDFAIPNEMYGQNIIY
jgi:hypothetical protein